MDKWLEAIVMGGMRLALYVMLAIAALFVFGFLAIVGMVIGDLSFGYAGGVVFGLLFGAVGTAAIAWVLYMLGKSFL